MEIEKFFIVSVEKKIVPSFAPLVQNLFKIK